MRGNDCRPVIAIELGRDPGIDPADVKRVFRFVKWREWRGAEPQASGEGEGLYSLYLGNKFLAMESGAEGAAGAQRDPAACREMTQTRHWDSKCLFRALDIENVQHRAIGCRVARASSYRLCQQAFQFFQLRMCGASRG
jgi:hypothetical protein